jgi:hypothetical protein
MSTDLLTRDSLAERQGSVWDYIPPSRLNLWLKCPLAFRLKYVDGIRTPTTPSLFVGKMCHAALECHYRHRQLGLRLEPVELIRRLGEFWYQASVDEDVSFQSVAEEDACRSQAAGLVSAYIAQLPDDEPKPLAVEAAVEAPLVYPSSSENLGIPLVGIMDLVLPDAAGPVITDSKTTARSAEPLEVAHEIQLSCYSYLFRHSSQEAESALEIRNLIKTKTPKVETHRYRARDERHYRRFVFRPGLGCSMCDFRGAHCRSWDG